MVMTDVRYGDKLWEDLATALLNDRFPESVTSVRANLHDLRGRERKEFKVNVYTRDFGEEEEVRRVEQAIVSNLNMPLGNISMLTYKPEIYSHLDIYANNKFGSQGRGIRASMYQSKSGNSRYLGRQRRQ